MNNFTKNIVFDLGGVLIDWDPLYVYQSYFDSEEKLNYFLKSVCTESWNEEQDSGKSIVEGTMDLIQKFPDWEKPIRDFYGRWTDMLKGPIDGSVKILKSIIESDRFRVLALTNWEAMLFQIAKIRYKFLDWFEGIVVSGEVKVCKPHPEIYQILIRKYDILPAETIFIDDKAKNISTAKDLGFQVILFRSPEQLEKDLKQCFGIYLIENNH